jgi:ribosomal protein S11
MLLEEVKALLDGEEEIKKIKDVTPIKLKAGESE